MNASEALARAIDDGWDLRRMPAAEIAAEILASLASVGFTVVPVDDNPGATITGEQALYAVQALDSMAASATDAGRAEWLRGFVRVSLQKNQ